LLLVGRSGAGKSFIARCVAEVAGVPYYRFDIQQISESGFRGITIESVLQAMYRAAGRSLSAMERMVVVVDEVDKRRIPTADNNVPEKRRADQASILSLLDGDGTPLAFNGKGEEGDTQVSTRGMLVVACGAFSDAAWSGRAPTRGELVQYGLLEEIVTRITEVLFIPDQTTEGLVEMFSVGVGSAAADEQALFEELGFVLEIDPAVYRYVAGALVRSGVAGASRIGRSCIVAAGREVLARALIEGRPIGTTLRVSPDDVTLPSTAPEPLDRGGREPPDPWIQGK
jgi:ATP-dependent protease Clp ATPase subunit